MQVKLMGEAATGSSPLQGPEYSWKQLEAEIGEMEKRRQYPASKWRQPSPGFKHRKG